MLRHTLLSSAVLSVACGLITSAPALAGDETLTTIFTVNNAGRPLTDGDTWVITSTGGIQVTLLEGISGEVDNFTLTNDGSITAKNPGPIFFPPFATTGISLLGDNNTITNNGTIETTDFDAIDLTGTSQRVTNNGTITSGDDGIDTNSNNDVIVNNGTITAARDGIETDGMGVTVTNAGTIVASSDAYDLNGDNSTLNLVLGSNSQGEFSFDGANSTFNIGTGMNGAFTTDGGNPDTITAARNAFLQDGNTIFALNLDQNLLGLTHLVNLGGALHETTQGQGRFGRNDVATRGATKSAGPWITMSSDYSQGLSTSQSAGYSTRAGQITIGFALGDTIGAFAATNSARFQRNSSFETDSNTQAVGLYGQVDLEGADLSWTLALGKASNSAQRQVQNNTVAGGFETATGVYDQTFVAPSLTYSTRLQPGVMLDVEIGYTQINADGYTETGATNNATFAARNTRVASVTPKVSWTTIGSDIPFDMSAGVELRRYWGDPVNVTIGAANGSFTDADSRFEAKAFVGGRIERPFGDGWLLTGFGQAGYSTYNAVSLNADFMISRSF